MIDLRSDTVTRPSEQMRAAIAQAPVDDDVIDVDPTVDRLQKLTAEMLGKEAAMFMPSGSMTNQVAVRLHCRPGDELICEEGCHIYNYEQGGFAQLSQAIARTVSGPRGILSVDQLKDLIRPDNEHAVRTRLICLENTHNRAGGVIQPYANLIEICQWAREHTLAAHLDGARLFNAVVATGISADKWCEPFDTVSVCFSKGLGAPVGSALAGPRDAIAEMRRHRKLFGGGMRQSGIIAAGALYALQNNIERLADDHQAAQVLAEAIRRSPGLQLEDDQIDTNIVIFRVATEGVSAAEFCKILYDHGVRMLPFSRVHLRACTHLDVTLEECQRAGEIIQQQAEQLLASCH